MYKRCYNQKPANQTMPQSQQLHQNVIKGQQAFNQGAYYAAHEYFEDAWRETLDGSREFYRALIMLSGGYFRLTQDRPDAALKFFSSALKWMEGFPSVYKGINTAAIKATLIILLKAIESGQSSEAILAQYACQIVWAHQEQSQ
jgi:predicted metal-dependent hydrolase